VIGVVNRSTIKFQIVSILPLFSVFTLILIRRYYIMFFV